jgi:hypothetical protein
MTLPDYVLGYVVVETRNDGGEEELRMFPSRILPDLWDATQHAGNDPALTVYAVVPLALFKD